MKFEEQTNQRYRGAGRVSQSADGAMMLLPSAEHRKRRADGHVPSPCFLTTQDLRAGSFPSLIPASFRLHSPLQSQRRARHTFPVCSLFPPLCHNTLTKYLADNPAHPIHLHTPSPFGMVSGEGVFLDRFCHIPDSLTRKQ